MFCAFGGAEGSLTTIRQVLKNSEKTSAHIVPPNTNVFWTFDNVQWRLYKLSKEKPLVAIATSMVQTFPDGLERSEIQYVP